MNTLRATIAMITALPLLLAPRNAMAQSRDTSTATAVVESKSFGSYTPGGGFKIANTDKGDLNVAIYTYVRYLNQLGLDSTYTDALGTTKSLLRRQDLQVQKVNIKFFGWLLNPKFRYLAYVWTSNTSQGQAAQVVVAGNLQYNFNEHFTVGGGIDALPGVRSTEGNFPFWLSVDNRQVATEFFRPSYTTGIWAKGTVVDRLSYRVMLGNNLSQLGIDAGQLDNRLNTWATALIWLPTTGEFGNRGGAGDFEVHNKLATRLAVHYTRSDEDFQGQADNSSFENVQLRLSNGGIVFTPDLFGSGIWVQQAQYQMTSVDAGVKYRGLSLDGEHYWRLIDNFRGPETSGLAVLRDHGFQLQASAMVLPQQLQLYASGSKIFGEYGNPSDVRLGVNWFPMKNQVVRWNAEYLHLDQSPVGGNSLPYVVGGNGAVFYTSFEVNF